MTTKEIVQKVINRSFLSEEEAYLLMLRIGNQELNDSQTVAIMTGLQMRGLQLNELIGFRNALLELAVRIKLEFETAIDVCGTGGDGKNTFNISTATAFVLASMGYKVVKHGNYGVSSLCGSSNVLEHLGFEFCNDQETLQRNLDKSNLCFLHAPLFHPALKVVAPLRKQLGVSTFFNGMGPLVNPVNPTHQLTGTYTLELAKLYQHVLRDERVNFSVLHGLDGFDELTFIGATRVFSQRSDRMIEQTPTRLDVQLLELSGGETVQESAQILVNLLNGQGTPVQQTVLAGNVALGIQTFKPEISFETAFETSLDFIQSGEAIQSFNLLRS